MEARTKSGSKAKHQINWFTPEIIKLLRERAKMIEAGEYHEGIEPLLALLDDKKASAAGGDAR